MLQPYAEIMRHLHDDVSLISLYACFVFPMQVIW